MVGNNIVHSLDPETDTFTCPKCKSIWRAKGYYDFDEGGWSHAFEEERCPNGCRNFWGLRLKGRVSLNPLVKY